MHLRCGDLALCVRNSLDYASWKDRKAVAAALRPIYTASNDVAAEDALTAFEQSEWGAQLPHVAASWRRAWDYVTPFFAFPPDIRRVIYTTNAIEDVATSRYVPVNARIRKVIKTRGHFPNDEAATKLIWLALRNFTKEWGGCPEFCVNGFRLMLRHSVLELDSKPV